MGRYSEVYKDIHGRDPTDFPPALNDKLEVGREYRLKLLTEPRIVKGRYGRLMPLVEVLYKSERYTLYIPWVDLQNRFALLEQELEKADEKATLKGKTISLRRAAPYRFLLSLLR